MRFSPVTLIAMAILFALGIGVGWYFQSASPVSSGVVAGEPKPLFYRSPMNPSVTSPVPAKDSMGMDYVAVYPGGASSGSPGAVEVDPVVSQSMGVRLAPAMRRDISKVVKAVGRVDFNEEKMTRLHPKTEGWIENIVVNRTGDIVKEDDILLSIYSPHLVTTQQEYLLARQTLKSAVAGGSITAIKSARQVVEAGRERLLLLDVPPHQIDDLVTTGESARTLHIHSPFGGAVIQIGARDGQFVTPRTELYMIADLSTVWVYADIYEYELPWVRVGDDAVVTLQAVPGREFLSKIAYIYPYMEAKTRTVRVRIELANDDEILKPEMYAQVKILARTIRDAIVVPSEAIIRSGANDQVFIVESAGKFVPRLVTVGLESDGMTQIIDGVESGENVVTSGQFLIDSESKLNEATSKMLPTGLESGEVPIMEMKQDVPPSAVDHNHD